MYLDINYKTNKAAKEALARGDEIHVQASLFGPSPQQGRVGVEGPWFPAPHSWYASVEVRDGKVTKIF